jgi:DNA-binding transcriptional MerR regulator
MGDDMDDAARAEEGLSIQAVSERLGVPAPTLRSWERRYGVPDTARSPGGHRRYSAEALHQLRLMRDEVALGRRAADAARAVRELLDPSNRAAVRIAELLSASEAMDPDALRAVLDRARDDLGLAATLDEVLMPAMRQIGSWWQTGRCDVGLEHLTTEVVRGWISRVGAFAPRPERGRPVLLACGPRDQHTVGLEALAALLAEQRRPSRVLGARTPQSTLVTAVAATGAGALVLVSHLPTHRRVSVDALRAVAETRCRIFYAGNAFVFPAARKGVPGTYLGETLTGAAALLATA